MKLDKQTWNELLNFSKKLEIKGESISVQRIIDHFKVTRHVAELYKFSIENKDITHNDLNAPLIQKNQEAKLKKETNINKELLDELEHTQKRLDFALGITEESKQSFKIPSYKINTRSRVKGKNEATAFAILSDIHIEEDVTLEQTDGINEYTPSIAEKRLENFFTNTLKLVEKEREHCNIDTLVLGLLGDNITGYIHEELMESNHLSPTEATTFVRNLLIQGIKYLADNGNFTKIIIPCTPGNHGRTTKYKKIGTGYKNSYEWMMYQDMKKIFNDYMDVKYKKLIEIHTSINELIYLDFYNRYTVRFGHGDHFKFAGGIGGLNIPLKKWLMRMNEQRKADMTFIGHWHQILLGVTEDCMINGSIIGMNSYSKTFGGINKPPQQIFTLLDKERGFTMRTPIDVLTETELNRFKNYRFF